MSKARKLADLGNVYDDGALSNRNLIINGAMQVAQRGTSTTGITGGGTYNTADRMLISMQSLGTWTVSQENNGPDGFANSYKALCTVADASPAANDYILPLSYKLEGQDLQQLAYGSSSAKAMTFSFWVKSNKTGGASIEFLQTHNTNKLYSVTYTINAADTWEYKTVTIDGDTSGVINDNNTTGMLIQFWGNSGSTYTGGSAQTWGALTNSNRNPSNLGLGGTVNDYFQITGVQLEVGDTATPFEHEPISVTLQKCQRYYWRVEPHTVDQVMLGNGYFYGSTTFRTFVPFPTTLRAEPSVTSNGLEVASLTSVDHDVSVISALDEGKDGIGLNIGDASGTVGYSGILRVGGDAGDYFAVDAEL